MNFFITSVPDYLKLLHVLSFLFEVGRYSLRGSNSTIFKYTPYRSSNLILQVYASKEAKKNSGKLFSRCNNGEKKNNNMKAYP